MALAFNAARKDTCALASKHASQSIQSLIKVFWPIMIRRIIPLRRYETVSRGQERLLFGRYILWKTGQERSGRQDRTGEDRTGKMWKHVLSIISLAHFI